MSDTKNWDFAGKYAISTVDNKKLFTVVANSIQLSEGDPNKPLATQGFNTYGDLKSGFTLQAPNTSWLYVEFASGSYTATRQRGDAGCSIFSIVFDGANQWDYIIETVGADQYYVVANSDGTLGRIAKSGGSPPAAAQFVLQNKPPITYGLAAMITKHSTLSNPLTGVYLAGKVLTNITFASSDVSYADFSGTTLDNTSSFSGCTAVGTKFDEAKLENWVAGGLLFSNCTFAGTNFTSAKLTSAVLNGCVLNQANFTSATLQMTDFTNAVMIGCKFPGALLNSAIFKGATLTNSDFSLAKVPPESVDFSDATLLAVNLAVIANPGKPNQAVVGTDFTKCKISTKTLFLNAVLNQCNFTGLDLRNMVFTRASMQNTKLDRAKMDGIQLAFADLSFASITGGVSMIGANLSNANLQAAKLPGAQLGAKVTLTALPLTDATLLDANKVPPDMAAALKLSDKATVSITQQGQSWIVRDDSKVYQVNNNGTALLVQQTTTSSNAAILTNAYLANTDLSQANLYAVEMSGVHWYGDNANATSADLSLANLSNANLRSMTFTQSQLQGAQLDYANLIATTFDGANLSPSAGLKPTSFAFSSLQSTIFKGLVTSLAYANLTNAAFCLMNESGGSIGVPLFTISAELAPSGTPPVISDALFTAFNDRGYPLLKSVATITVTEPKTAWTINNIDEENASQVGYGNFLLRLVTQVNQLQYIQVYGKPPLLVQEVDASGQYQQVQLAFGYTAASQSQMNGETTCPSGMKLKYLSQYLPFETLMTAALPPKPPVCANCWG